MSLFAVALLAAVFFAIVYDHWKKRHTVTKFVEHHRSIIDFSYFGVNSLGDRLHLRAYPNRRLVKAFGIQNSFTTDNPLVHRRFLRLAGSAIKKINANPLRWSDIGETALSTLDRIITTMKWEDGVPVAKAVRAMCLDAVLVALFPGRRRCFIDLGSDTIHPDVQATSAVAETINKLWVLSKVEKERNLREIDRTRVVLYDGLGHLLRHWGDDSFKEDLGLILPAYETLWRVVLLAYVDLAFRCRDYTVREALYSLVGEEAPIVNDGRNEPGLLLLSKEALRLYAPTRRIHRGIAEGTVAADVEALHRDIHIWGRDALEFRHTRFHNDNLLPIQKRAYVPFGAGLHVCPASNGFAERMVLEMLSALLKRFGIGQDWKGSLSDPASINFGRGGVDWQKPLPTGRMDMEDWTLKPGSMARDIREWLD